MSSEVIAPGQAGEIRARFDPKNRHGKYKKNIRVFSNDKKQPISNLYLVMEIAGKK
ncbi:MAG TPA: DUF1573 domain-containing protein [Caldithrix abyssi]|uniref:DUF1573 domain-containing protein n=1 Tax=Caldithrix abyssi TaxID=187145 RepID=A0A7V4U2T7_CALAY|nr:DUF1573 domain-containing protein [Caldithrix abyssi]